MVIVIDTKCDTCVGETKILLLFTNSYIPTIKFHSCGPNVCSTERIICILHKTIIVSGIISLIANSCDFNLSTIITFCNPFLSCHFDFFIFAIDLTNRCSNLLVCTHPTWNRSIGIGIYIKLYHAEWR